MSLISVVRFIDRMNEVVGRAVAWVALLMVLDQFIVVVLRYVFSVGFIPMQESVWYMHGVLFMIGAGYTLLHNGHVRVDIFYREASPRRKALVDLFGVVAFLIPVCVLFWWYSWPYVMHSWSVRESSMETMGLPILYLLKTVILVFVVLVFAQGVSLGLRSLLTLVGTPVPETEEHRGHET